MTTRSTFIQRLWKHHRMAFSAFIFLVCSGWYATESHAQPASATWALTSGSAVVVSGNITATAHAFSAGLTGKTYNATNGATAANFNGVICTPNGDDYNEFTVSTTCGNELTINAITFDYKCSNASPNPCLQIKYSIDGSAETQLGSDIPITSTSITPYTTGAISLVLSQGKTMTLRIYGATNSTIRTLSIRNFTINGNTSTVTNPAPVIFITSDPSGAICPGNLVTFTASIQNGGSSPAYQWKVNGNNLGSSLPVYSSSVLADGDQVSCELTSNLTCVDPATVLSNIITITYLPTVLATPGPITGPALVDLHQNGLTYGIAVVPDATSYIWTLPQGWTITSGAGTTGITATAGGTGSGGSISVVAANACVTSAPSSLTVQISPPHDNCNQCHMNHTSPGMVLTNAVANANVCMSCHNTNGSASLFPFSNAMKAVPGVGGTSHSWDQAAVSALYETNVPSNPDMASRLPGGQIICSTCHNQHNPYTNKAYLRTSNTGDAVCKDCHSARNVGTYASDPASNKGSHPVGVNFNPANTGMQPQPAPPFSYPDNKVECSSCHQTHYAASTDGNLLRSANTASLCTSCHIEKSPTQNWTHEGLSCKSCHDAHNPDKTNVLMIGSTIATPNSGDKDVIFSSNLTPGSYADGSGPYDGVCEVCHTTTVHYTNVSGGVSDDRHNPAPQSCVSCHPHNQGFYPVTDCFACHNAVTDMPGVGPDGGRRQIVDNTGNGFGTGGDFKRYSHHVFGAIPSVSDCSKCHYMGDHMNGTVKLLDPDQGYLSVITYDPLNKASVETFCLNCHDAGGANGAVTPFSDNLQVPVISAALWNASSHKNNLSCLDCHDNGHGSNKSLMLGPFDYSGPGTGSDLMNEEEAFCLQCHGGSGSANVKVQLAFSSYSNTATDYFKHNPQATYRVHSADENDGNAFGGTNRHVECVDCHNPHGVVSGTATAPAMLPTLTGASGVTPLYNGPGAPTGFTWHNNASAEYEVCYKCHSSFTTLPTYLPSGWDGAALVADGLQKLTTGGVNNQIADNRDMAREFNPANKSFHPVMGTGTNAGINTQTFQTGWNSSSRMYCSSCHNNPMAANAGQGRGPHGSQNLHILDQRVPGGAVANYKTNHNTSVISSSNDVCGKCHQDASYWSNNLNTRYPAHDAHINEYFGECYLCHDTHGSEQMHLINFNRNNPNCITSVTPNTQDAFNHAVGSANSCVLTCHTTTHSTSSRTYTPAYP